MSEGKKARLTERRHKKNRRDIKLKYKQEYNHFLLDGNPGDCLVLSHCKCTNKFDNTCHISSKRYTDNVFC